LKLTEALAIYAACLSTFVFIWNVGRATPRFKVELGVGINEEDGEVRYGAFVIVKNPSAQTIHLSNISMLYLHCEPSLLDKIKFALKYRRFPHSVGWVYTSLSNYGIDDRCPVSIEPGASHCVFVSEDKIEKMLDDTEIRKIRAVGQDQLSRNKYATAIEWTYVSKKNT
jgi:hypothetical protein